jgi:acetyltransferase-like isoleucine patch superfamily enzyme
MESTSTPVLSRADTLDAGPGAVVEVKRPRAWLRVYDRALPLLRLFCIRVLNYVTNYVVAYVPSFAFRRLWYRCALGIQIGGHVGVFMGTYVWFYGPRANRRLGVRIGRNTRINRRCTLDVRCGLTIGDNVSISPEVMILAASHDINDPGFGSAAAAPVAIEDHAFIGTRAMILPGVTVGRGAVVVAGSQVSKDVPPMTIVGGTPARPIGMRDPGATAYELGDPLPLFE